MGANEHTPGPDGPRNQAAVYSFWATPPYIYFPDPEPETEEHVSERVREWSLIEEWCRLLYGLDGHERTHYDAYDGDRERDVEIKCCIRRRSSGERGRMTLLSRQHHRLVLADGDYLCVVYDQYPPEKREPAGAWWFIKCHVRIPARILHRTLAPTLSPASGNTQRHSSIDC